MEITLNTDYITRHHENIVTAISDLKRCGYVGKIFLGNRDGAYIYVLDDSFEAYNQKAMEYILEMRNVYMPPVPETEEAETHWMRFKPLCPPHTTDSYSMTTDVAYSIDGTSARTECGNPDSTTMMHEGSRKTSFFGHTKAHRPLQAARIDYCEIGDFNKMDDGWL
jgi:hypothetical protein